MKSTFNTLAVASAIAFVSIGVGSTTGQAEEHFFAPVCYLQGNEFSEGYRIRVGNKVRECDGGQWHPLADGDTENAANCIYDGSTYSEGVIMAVRGVANGPSLFICWDNGGWRMWEDGVWVTGRTL